MPAASCFFAVDLGASSGRTALVRLDEQNRVSLEETHRFANGPVERGDGLCWDVDGIFREITHGLAVAAERAERLDGIGVDTWGVDYALLDADGSLGTPPRHYRDPRTNGVMDRLLQRRSRESIYGRTGIQFMPINTIYQLATEDWGRLADDSRLLFMPDVFNYWLCGVAGSDATIASTSQLYDAAAGEWVVELLAEVGAPASLMPAVAAPGTVLGPLRPEVARQAGLAHQPPVIAAAGHDTACAVAAVPATEGPWAYISSGTWSLVGVELPASKRDQEALADGFTNEAGAAGTVRFLRNVAGLWLLQECRRAWAEAGESLSFEQISTLAKEAKPHRSLLNPDAAAFLEPGDMPRRIVEWCKCKGEPVPRTVGEFARCVLESLALTYRAVLERLNTHLPGPVERLHVVGGGSRNDLLNQFTADACGLPVIAGPSEATVLGNGLLQALAVGRISSLAELRGIVRTSTELRYFQPNDTSAWLDAARRYEKLAGPA
ncbi:MAG: rhamnulokinase family protein [Phycisphaerales bacterium JB038]